MFAQFVAAAAGFHADQPHGFVLHERMENSDGIAAAADAGDHLIRQAAFGFENLLARFEADHAMKIAHHGGIRMRAQRRAQQVMGVGDVGDPVAHGFADGVFQGAAAGGDGHHLRAQQAHAEDVEALPAHVFLAHVDRAVEAEQRADGGAWRRHAGRRRFRR